MKDFVQKRLFITKKVTFKNDGIIYYSGDFLESREIFISFDEIMTNSITREFRTNKLLIWVTIAFAFVYGFFLLNPFNINPEINSFFLYLSGFLCLILLILTILSRKHMLYIATLGGFLIDFYDLNPSKELVEEFLNTLKKKSFKYLKAKYTKIDVDISFEKQLENFIYLRDKNVITQKEYETLKKKLKNIEPDVKGFRY
ncbi:hypothetical protein [Lutibacter sp.]|uniref:hypothetical protein n=1 Tax=Lutibacter sp. TaxID=1925666 RepID=UPI003565AB95